jgi:hypothetical protein
VDLIGDSNFGGNCCQGFIGLDKTAADMLHARAEKRVGDRAPAKTAKRAAQMRGVNAGMRSNCDQVNRFAKTLRHHSIDAGKPSRLTRKRTHRLSS